MRPSGTSEEVTTVGPLGISRLDLEQVSTLVRNVDFLVPHLDFLYCLLEQPCPSPNWQLADGVLAAGGWGHLRMGALRVFSLVGRDPRGSEFLTGRNGSVRGSEEFHKSVGTPGDSRALTGGAPYVHRLCVVLHMCAS